METNMFPVAATAQDKLKSYWERPGGKAGVFIGLGLLALIAYFVVPILTTIVWNTLNFGIALVCLGVFLYCVTHRKLRMSLFYLYEIMMKKLVGFVIELDPFIIAEDYIGDMEKQRETLYNQSIDVDGQKEKIDLKLNEKEKEMNNMLAKAKAAKDNNMMPELGNATRQVARINEYIKQLAPIRDSLAKIGDYLTKVHKNSGYLIEDAKNELELKKDLYKSVTSGNQALNSAMKIFKGDPEKKLMVEQSMEYLKDDIAGKLASMKKAISYSTDFMRSIDLDNATFEVEGLKMLEAYDSDSELKLNTQLWQPTNTPTVPGKVNSDYNDLLN
jgi:phage shock protein A